MTDDPEWLAWRRGGITASDVAKASTGMYGGSPMGVVADKLGLTPRVEPTEAMLLGHQLEGAVTAAASAMLGLPIGHTQAWLQHAELGWPRATIDGVILPDTDAELGDLVGIAEIKTRRRGVPRPSDYYRAQTAWQMFVADVDMAVIAEAIVDDDGVILSVSLDRVERDAMHEAGLIDLAADMWAWVQRGEVPPPSSPHDLDVVRALHATVTDTESVVDLGEHLSLLERRGEIVDRLKALTDEKRIIEGILMDAVGGARKGDAPGWRVSFSAPSRVLTDEGEAAVLAARPELGRTVTVLDRERAKEEAPELIDANRGAVGPRKLTIKRKKDS